MNGIDPNFISELTASRPKGYARTLHLLPLWAVLAAATGLWACSSSDPPPTHIHPQPQSDTGVSDGGAEVPDISFSDGGNGDTQVPDTQPPDPQTDGGIGDTGDPGEFDGGDAAMDEDVAVPHEGPIADIQANPSVIREGAGIVTVVTLDGTASQSPEGLALTYQWHIPACDVVEGDLETSWVRCAFTGEQPIPVELVVTDSNNEEDIASVELPFNRPPTVDLDLQETAWRHQEVIFTASASDPEGEELIPQISLLQPYPPGTVLTQSGPGQATLVCPQPGSVTVQATATDSLGATGLANDTIAFPNRAPELEFIGNRGVSAGGTLIFEVVATDPDGDPITLNIEGLPFGATFSSGTGIFRWTTGLDQVGNHHMTITANDGWDSDQQEVMVNVIDQGGTAFMALNPPAGSHEIRVGQVLRILVQAWSGTGQALLVETEDLPPNSTFVEGLWEFIPSEEAAGTHEVEFWAMNGAQRLSREVLVGVLADDNTPPIVQIVPEGEAFQVLEGERLELTVSAIDPDGGNALLWAENLPANATFISEGSQGTLVFNPDYNQAGVYQVYFVASDGHDTTRHLAVLVVIDVNRPPTLSLDPGDNIVTLVGEQILVRATAWDPDGDEISLALNTAPMGSSFDPVGGVFTWTPLAHQIGDHQVVIDATDHGAPPQTASAEATISVRQNNQPPTVILAIPDMELPLGHMANLDLNFHFRDPDGDLLNYSLPSSPPWVTLSGSTVQIHPRDEALTGQTFTVTARASDGSSFAETSFQVTVLGRPEGSYLFSTIASPGDPGPTPLALGTLYVPLFSLTGDVLFASHHEGERWAIYRWNQAEGVTKIIERYDRTPNREAYRSFGSFFPALDDGLVFVGHSWGKSGVFHKGPASDDPLTALVRQDHNAPGELRLGTVGMDSLNTSNEFGWCASPFGSPTDKAAFVWIDGSLRTASKVGVPAPGGGLFGSCLGRIIVGEGHHVAFLGQLGGGANNWGLFSWLAGASTGPGASHGTWSVPYRTDAPGEIGALSQISDFQLATDGTIFFLGINPQGRRGLYKAAWQDDTEIILAEGSPASDSGTVETLGPFLLYPNGEAIISFSLESDPGRFGVYRLLQSGDIQPLLTPGTDFGGGLRLRSAHPQPQNLPSPERLLFHFQTESGGPSGYGLLQADGEVIIVALAGDPLPDGTVVGSYLHSPTLSLDGHILFQESPGGTIFLGAPH